MGLTRKFFLVRSLFAACLFSGATLAASGCVPRSYVGISLIPGAAPADLQALAMLARDGDQDAQLKLGIRYEEGVGVHRDRTRAARLYMSAARDIGGAQLIYTLSSGKKGEVTSVNLGPR